MNEDDYLYREFWIKATAEKLIEMSADLNKDKRVKDFDKFQDEDIPLCKTDKRLLSQLLYQAKLFILDNAKPDDIKAQNLHRRLGLLANKLNKNNGQAT